MQFPVNRTIVDQQGNRRKILEVGSAGNACLVSSAEGFDSGFDGAASWLTETDLKIMGFTLEEEHKGCRYGCKCDKGEEGKNHCIYCPSFTKEQEPVWRPYMNCLYFKVDDDGLITSCVWTNGWQDYFRLSIGNIHKTEEAALQWKQKLIERMGN